MKRSISVLVIGVMALVLVTGCASGPTVSRVDANTQIDVSGHWNDTDIRLVCDTLINDALTSARVDRYIKEYEAKNNGEHPRIILGTIENKSKERMDTGVISRIMRTAIINSDKLEFVEGGDARSELRAERQDQNMGNASENTQAALGNETGANFMLQGTVDMVPDEAVVGGKRVKVNAYFVRASITDIEKNTILWEGENNEVKKVITQNSKKL